MLLFDGPQSFLGKNYIIIKQDLCQSQQTQSEQNQGEIMTDGHVSMCHTLLIQLAQIKLAQTSRK